MSRSSVSENDRNRDATTDVEIEGEHQTSAAKNEQNSKPFIYIVVASGSAIDEFIKGIGLGVSPEDFSDSLCRNIRKEMSTVGSSDNAQMFLFIPTDNVRLKTLLPSLEPITDREQLKKNKTKLVVGNRDADLLDADENSVYKAVVTESLLDFQGEWFVIKKDESVTKMEKETEEENDAKKRIVWKNGIEKIQPKDVLKKSCYPQDEQCNIRLIYSNRILQDVKKLLRARRTKVGSTTKITGGHYLDLPGSVQRHIQKYGRPPFQVPNYKRSHRTAYELIRRSFP